MKANNLHFHAMTRRISHENTARAGFGLEGSQSWRGKLLLWFKRAGVWLSIKKLEHELRDSRSFQRHCEKIGCLNLAELEEGYQELLAHKISRLQMAQTKMGFNP